MKTAFNFVAFYLGWFACALGAASGFPLLGSLVVAVLLTIHLAFLSLNPARESLLLVSAGLLGTALDSTLMSNGLYTFTGHASSGLCPFWIIALWMIFASTFDHALSWLRKRYVLAALFGAIGGPLSYAAGERLGALVLPQPATMSLIALACVWGAAMPALLWLTDVLLNSPAKSKAAVSALLVWLLLCSPPIFPHALADTRIKQIATVEIEEVSFATQHQTPELSLALRGYGLLHYRIFFKAYVAALYLGQDVPSNSVLSDVPKRLEIEYFWSIAGTDFGPAGEEILKENVPEETFASLRSRLEQINALYIDVKPGDRYALTYVPGVGTELALNGNPRGIIEGADFAAAYFAIWLGPQSLDNSLKAKLLRMP